MEHSLVLDMGSYTTKAGYSNGKKPEHLIPSLVGNIRSKFVDKFSKDTYVGQEALETIEYLSLRKVIDHGYIHNFDDYELLLQNVFSKFGLESLNDTCILFSEPILSPSNTRHKIIEIAFETFDANTLNISPATLLAIYGIGEITGTVIEIGDGITQCVPVIEGYVEKQSVRRNDFGGAEISRYLQKLLALAGFQFSTRKESTFVYDIKEKLCFCSLNPSKDEVRTDLKAEYVLPDGYTLADDIDTVFIETERFYAPEVIFNPVIMDTECPNIVSIVWDSIQACPVHQRMALTSKIILSGGSTKFENFPQRLQVELKNVAPQGARDIVKVNAIEEREFLPWMGGAYFASETMRQANINAWITSEEWAESGITIIQKFAQI
ncbi:actin-like protein homolog, ALP1 homolog [Babesia microti strain RI]|uniref:Actin-like protein homolog, ALP1 homolog n=1 Tax=Babesia microti (strain RI) TaxID=1133968 RepID=A0A0K3APE9_BABMR|nr:actin-like protein homolog, ALP1 homolog [Babesia microti strain RI]CTQ41362.1 actin-like protein homolog, ALP1 homolog [Babesia microti strain RI]|eukprot:XP_012649373.1 actin-like protein homolog, ALP1 homolog [Babesia microti strain RI]